MRSCVLFITVIAFAFCSCGNKSEGKGNSSEASIKTGNDSITSSNSQNNAIADFESYSVLQEFEGDLNDDNEIDKIVILEKECVEGDNEYIENAQCRRVAIYLQKQKKYVLYGYNDNLIGCSECGGGAGDPFRDVVLKKPYFSFESLYGDCDKTFIVTTFKYDKAANDFYLFKHGTEDSNCREENNPNGEINVKSVVKTKKDFGVVKFIDYESSK